MSSLPSVTGKDLIKALSAKAAIIDLKTPTVEKLPSQFTARKRWARACFSKFCAIRKSLATSF